MYISVVNTLLQVTVTIFSPIRLLSMLATPLEVQLRDEKRISNPVTPATISIQHFLDHFHDPSDRSVRPIYYTPFPFSMVNHFDYYDREREENQNRVFIRLRNKTAGIWGSWLRLPDVYYGQSYRLCRIHIPIHMIPTAAMIAAPYPGPSSLSMISTFIFITLAMIFLHSSGKPVARAQSHSPFL